MKKTILLLIFCYTLSLTYAGTTIQGSIQSGGITRTYRLYVPAVYNAFNPAVPLIINLHGYTSNATDQQNYTNFMAIADTANFLMVCPQGTVDAQGSAFWNAFVDTSLVDDLSFLSNLIDSIKADYNIDLNRVYSTGLSNGGFMSHLLACKMNNRIAAIASVAGTFFTYQFPFSPDKAVPVMQIHGTMDGTVPYNGYANMLPVDSTISFWVTNNHCNVTPVFTAIPNTNTFDGCTAENYVYSNGDNGTVVELYKIIGGGHTWPGGSVTIGTTNRDFNASKEIWRFFRQFSLSQPTGKSNNLLPEKSTLLFSNPVSNSVLINSENNTDATITIFNTIGVPVLSEKLHDDKKEINVSSLSDGTYFMRIAGNAANDEFRTIVIKNK